MFYYLIITLGAGGCRKLLSFVGRQGVTKKLGRKRERERERERGRDGRGGIIVGANYSYFANSIRRNRQKMDFIM